MNNVDCVIDLCHQIRTVAIGSYDLVLREYCPLKRYCSPDFCQHGIVPHLPRRRVRWAVIQYVGQSLIPLSTFPAPRGSPLGEYRCHNPEVP
ncbi:hypothetical protein TNCV_219101 [Trichonephila clavipes]|nr:hypothetical protein TNCV_219101 [Trichonephila clavipes]